MQKDYCINDAKQEMGITTVTDRLTSIEQLMFKSVNHESPSKQNVGRSAFTRIIDLAFASARRYVPPVHWLGVTFTALILYLYARLVAFTGRLRTIGEIHWPDIYTPCVIALWHRDAPSFFVGFAMCRPKVPCSIMISGDSRGDCLALLARLLGLHVVRGSSEKRGWEALVELSKALLSGSAVIITADGGGPARVAKVGAVALASGASVPLVPLVADCYPALEERHKWDRARNPLPFSSVTISMGPARSFEPLTSVGLIEQARGWLESNLNQKSSETSDVVNSFHKESGS